MTLSTFKKTAVALIASTVLALPASAAVSLFGAGAYTDAFFSPQQVLEAYKGKWSGRQQVKVGNNTGTGRIEINYSPDPTSENLRLIGIGRVFSDAGGSMPTMSFMYCENSQPILQVNTEDGGELFYKGYISNKSITWVPLYDFFLYDYQKDTFRTEDGERMMDSEGARSINYKDKWFLVKISAQYEFVKSAYPADKVKSSITKKVNAAFEGAASESAK